MASNGVTRPPALDVTMQEILDALKAVSFRPQVIDNLTSQDSGAPLSANQGRVLKNAIDDIVTQSITDGDTSHAPSGDAVHDALNAIRGITPTALSKTSVTCESGVTIEDGPWGYYEFGNFVFFSFWLNGIPTGSHKAITLPFSCITGVAINCIDFSSDDRVYYARVASGGGSILINNTKGSTTNVVISGIFLKA